MAAGRIIEVKIKADPNRLTIAMLRLQLGVEVRARVKAERAARIADGVTETLIAAAREAGLAQEREIETLREALELRKEMHNETRAALAAQRQVLDQTGRELSEQMVTSVHLAKRLSGARLALENARLHLTCSIPIKETR